MKHRKNILLNKVKKLWKRNIKSKLKRKEKRKKLKGVKRKYTKDKNSYLEKNWDSEKIRAPNNFSFIEKTNDVVSFINKLSDCFDKRKKVFIVLKNVENITYDALVVLLSIMVKFKSKKIGFNGDFPKNKKAFEILTQSGFFEYLYFSNFKSKDTYDLPSKSGIHTHAMKNVDSILGDKIITNASKTIWNEKRRCQGVQKTLLELMQNTNNHADIDMEGVKHWWLSAFHIKEEKKVTFSFVDFGVGIFNSLDNKPQRSKWYGWGQKLAAAFSFSNNAELLKLIMDGKLHTTITNKPYRGKGLPGLKLTMDRNQISNLHIISNNVKADVKNNAYTLLNKNFNGTFVYWELTETNKNCDGDA